jgi:hypothetical protein
MELQDYISSAFPQGLSYNDAAQLCLRLYCTLDGVPAELHTQCNKDNLSEVFARLSSGGFVNGSTTLATLYGASFHSVTDKGHWVEVIASIFKKGDTVDASVAKTLAQTLNNSLKSDAAKPRTLG